MQSRMNQAHKAATNGQATDAPMQTIDWVCVAIGIAFWALYLLFIIVVIVAAGTSSLYDVLTWSGRTAPAISAARPSSTITAVSARGTLLCSPMKPISGGPARNAQ